MSEMRFTEAFAKYGAKLVNAQWAFSSIAEDGALVISCWQHKFSTPQKGLMRYSDCLSRWNNPHSAGRNLFVEHLEQAYKEQLPVRLVIASTKDTAIVDAGEDAGNISKTFHIRKDFVGQVTSFDGDAYVIEFVKQESM